MSQNGKTGIRALVLLSGGLDSQLAVCVLREQGIDVQGISFLSPFFDDTRSRRAAEQIGIPLHSVDFTGDILSLLDSPPHGFGSAINPCIDCHAAMVRRAGEWSAAQGIHFIATGEVLNQRPMSQNRKSLDIVAEASGCGDLLVRPLSAQLLPATRPEREGWVDRSRLLGIEGRSRRVQLDLARRFGLRDIPTPAGGCVLTEPHFAERVRDLKRHEGLQDPGLAFRLRWGRHFRLGDRVKVIVGRNQQENEWIENHVRKGETLLFMEETPGPSAIVSGPVTEELLRVAAGIVAGCSDGKERDSVAVRVRNSGEATLMVAPLTAAAMDELRIA